jgi:hypothetical protein
LSRVSNEVIEFDEEETGLMNGEGQSKGSARNTVLVRIKAKAKLKALLHMHLIYRPSTYMETA